MTDIFYAYTTTYSGNYDNSPSAGEDDWSGGGGLTDDQIETTVIGNEYSSAGAVVILKDTTSTTGESIALKVKYYYSRGYMYLNGVKTWIPGSTTYITDMVATERGQVVGEFQNIDIPLTTLSFYSGDRLLEEIHKWDDWIVGANENDVIWGYRGDDVLIGNGGNDVLVGGTGSDSLFGGSGDDILKGSSGVGTVGDYYSGGDGFDKAELTAKPFDYSLSRSPTTGITQVWYESGFKVATITSSTEVIVFGNGSELNTSSITYKGAYTKVETGSVFPIYRFYNNRDKAFFYTSSKDEKDYVIANSAYSRPDADEWPYVYQGATFEAAHTYLNSTTVTPVFRFYNHETGHHFFTVAEAEADMILGKIASGEWPFNYEGTRFSVYSGDPTPNFQGDEIAVHRFYSPTLNRHFFTADTEEVNLIKLTGVWDYEGIAFWGEGLG